MRTKKNHSPEARVAYTPETAAIEVRLPSTTESPLFALAHFEDQIGHASRISKVATCLPDLRNIKVTGVPCFSSPREENAVAGAGSTQPRTSHHEP